MVSFPRDPNYVPAIGGKSTTTSNAIPISAISLTDSTGLVVAIVDGNGDQITSFGGGTQYTDAGTAATHPIGTGIIFNNGGTYNFVSAAQPLPITGSLSITNPSTGSAVPSTANYIAASKAGTLTGLLLGSQTSANSLAVVIASDQGGVPVTGTFFQATQPISVASGGIASGAIASGAIASGAAVSGAFADGAIVTLGAKTDAKSTATDATSVTIMQVLKQISASVQAPPSQAVTNAGTFAVTQATGTNLHTVIDSGTVTTVSTVTNLAQMNGVALLMGNGVTGTGSQRVTIASDNTAFSIKNQDGSGNALTSNSTTFTAKFGLDVNMLGTLGTAFSTAGKVDVKGADGDVFVRQATGTNLHAVVDSGTITTVSTVTAVTAISNALPAGSNNIGQVTPVPTSNTGWTFFYNAGGITSTKVQIKGSAGTFGGWAWLYNPNTAATFIQVFNKASASVTVGSTTPDFVIVLPGLASASGTGTAANMEMVMGIAMSTGITVAATTTETGSTAPSNALFCTFLYK